MVLQVKIFPFFTTRRSENHALRAQEVAGLDTFFHDKTYNYGKDGSEFMME